MLKNYLHITLRILRKHILYSSINILGFALGIACCLLISLYVWHEWSYDRHYTHGDRFFRVKAEIQLGAEKDQFARTPHILAPTIKREIPDIEEAIRIQRVHDPVIKTDGKKLGETRAYYADAGVFQLFELELSQGSLEKWSENAHQVIISQSMADKYFPHKNPIGNYLEFEGLGEIQVKGVFRESKENSHLSFNMILPYVWAEKMAGEGANSWDMLVISTYLLTKEGINVNELENKITGLAASYSTSEDQVNYSLDPVSEIYLSANLDGDLGRQSDITYIYIFSSIALLILLIAVLNFISLSSARAIERAGEVGIRKVFGANRSQLMQQFLGEAAVLVFMALLISLGMVELAMPYFNQLIDRELIFPLFENLWLIPGLIVGGGMLALIAGAYPALILSGFNPRQIFSSGVKQSKSLGSRFRGGLVIVQFSITFILISSTIIINQQLNFLHRKDLGFNQDFVLVVPLKGEKLKRDYELFKNELTEFSGISSATASYHTPGRGLGMYFFDLEGEKEPLPLVSYSVDEDFLSTLEIEVMEGRGFSKNMTTDSSGAFLVNEAFVKQFGWDTEALGKQIIADGGKKGNVIGVLKDFHFQSLYQPVVPMVMQMEEDFFSRVSVRVNEGSMDESLDHIKKTFEAFAPNEIFEYSFLDEDMEREYGNARRTSKVLWIFSLMAIVIASLGLLGLVVANTLKRTKEMGIRKVLGASRQHIFVILVKGYVWLILFAFVFTLPLTIWLMNQWLNEFAYHVQPGVTAFVMAFAIIILISFMTIGYFSIKASRSNPVDALRYE